MGVMMSLDGLLNDVNKRLRSRDCSPKEQEELSKLIDRVNKRFFGISLKKRSKRKVKK